jgi:hypothetical protein
MHRRRLSLAAATAAPLLVLISVACGRGDDAAAGGGESASASSASSAGTKAVGAMMGGGSMLKVSVAGGAHAGKHEKKHDTPTCTIGYAGKGAWGNAASDTDDNEGLVGMDLIVKDTADAYRGTSDFMAVVYFDDRLQEKNQLQIEPKEGKGSGTVKVARNGDKATVTLNGKTADGTAVDATVDCETIMMGS